jgi:hypothetical protein
MARDRAIRFYTSEANRRRIKTAADEEGYTYEELVLELLEFRDEYRDQWDARDNNTARRPSGSGGSG